MKEFFILPESIVTRNYLMNTTNRQLAFPNTSISARETLPKAESKGIFVIVNVQRILKREMKELYSNHAMNVINMQRMKFMTRNNSKVLFRVITDSSSRLLTLVTASFERGARIAWLVHRCDPRKHSSHMRIHFTC